MQKKTSDFETNENIGIEDLLSAFNEFVGSFNSDIFSAGIVEEISEEQLKTYMANPDKYQKELEKITQYYYISNGDIFQLLDLVKTLPTLNYKLVSEDESDQNEKNLKKCNAMLKKIRYKTLTRDIISQLISSGTVVGIWLGKKNNPYFYTFNDLKQVFPSHRKNGRWVALYDISYLEGLDDAKRNVVLNSLHPYVNESMYNAYLKDSSKRYVELPDSRTVVLRTHTLFRNQPLGLSWALQSLFPLIHKKRLTDMEKNVANRVLNGIALLMLGNKDFPNTKLSKAVKKKVHDGVKTGLEKSKKDGVSVLTVPDWGSLTFPEIKNSDIALGEEKYKSVNLDLSTSSGVSSTLLTGSGGNYASAKMNLEILYKKIAVLLEDIEEIYNILFNIILPAKNKDQYYLEFDKQMPIDEKTKIDLLMNLHRSEGFSLKSVIDEIPGLTFDEYIRQSLYEQKDMKLHEKIKPYASSFTGGKTEEENKGGRPENKEDLNDSTIRNKENLGNDQ